MLKVSQNRWDSLTDLHNSEGRKKAEIINGRKYLYLDRYDEFVEVEIANTEISPVYGAITVDSPWEGNCTKKPWHYQVTAVIPALNTSETLPICIELLRLQSLKPFIMIIDTGSIEEHFNKIMALRAEDVEVHTIALNGVRHPSDYPAMAMDLAFTLCRTEYLFATHADCFLRKRSLLEDMITFCKTFSPAVGYELSPRAHPDWKGMLSHTASMYHMKTMDNIGFGWSLRRLCHRYDIVDYKPDPMKPNWPDTEILGNYILRDNGITPHLIGTEGNQCRTLDDNIDHFRSYTAGKMYSPDYYKITQGWYEDAKSQALARIEQWKNEPAKKPPPKVEPKTIPINVVDKSATNPAIPGTCIRTRP
jgi:hypothetical protein